MRAGYDNRTKWEGEETYVSSIQSRCSFEFSYNISQAGHNNLRSMEKKKGGVRGWVRAREKKKKEKKKKRKKKTFFWYII